MLPERALVVLQRSRAPCRSAVPTIAYSLRQIPEERWLEMHRAVQDHYK
jgi:hypothetical protein